MSELVGNYLRRAEQAEAQAEEVECVSGRERYLELAALWRQIAAELGQDGGDRPRVAA